MDWIKPIGGEWRMGAGGGWGEFIRTNCPNVKMGSSHIKMLMSTFFWQNTNIWSPWTSGSHPAGTEEQLLPVGGPCTFHLTRVPADPYCTTPNPFAFLTNPFAFLISLVWDQRTVNVRCHFPSYTWPPLPKSAQRRNGVMWAGFHFIFYRIPSI